jgi:hypothetical protein
MYSRANAPGDERLAVEPRWRDCVPESKEVGPYFLLVKKLFGFSCSDESKEIFLSHNRIYLILRENFESKITFSTVLESGPNGLRNSLNLILVMKPVLRSS